MLKRLIRDALVARGYHVKWIGLRSAVTGVELWHDVRVLLKDKRNALCLDVGANVGQSIEAIRGELDDPRIIAFEPVPETFERLSERHRHTPNVTLERAALGDSPGTVAMRLAPRRGDYDSSVSDSLLQSTENVAGDTVEVPLWTLDEYAERSNLKSIDMLKIDAEGYDLQVLRGATRLLDEQRIQCFSVEVLGRAIYQQQPEFADFLGFASSRGYTLNGVYDAAYEDNWLHHSNALFVRQGRTRH